MTTVTHNGVVYAVIYTPYIVKKGRKIFRGNGRMFRFEVPLDQYRAR